jgi:hypothetical protein
VDRTRQLRLAALLILSALSALTACSDDDSPAPQEPPRLLPLAVGNYWSFEGAGADTVLTAVEINGVEWFEVKYQALPILSGNRKLLRYDESGRLLWLTNGHEAVVLDPEWPVLEPQVLELTATPTDDEDVVVTIGTKTLSQDVLGQAATGCFVVGFHHVGVFDADWVVTYCPGIGPVRVNGAWAAGPLKSFRVN